MALLARQAPTRVSRIWAGFIGVLAMGMGAGSTGDLRAGKVSAYGLRPKPTYAVVLARFRDDREL